MHITRHSAPLALCLTGVALFAGCGSSKPAYCTQVNNFKNSVNELEKVELSPTNVSGITTALQKVQSSGKEMVSAVKTEFAPQIATAKSSLSALEKTVTELAASPSSSSLAHAVSVVPGEIEAVKKAAEEVEQVTKSKCE